MSRPRSVPGSPENAARSWPASCSARTRVSPTSCATASRHPASSTCSPSPARTSRSSPASCSSWPGCSAIPRIAAEVAALGAIGGYVLAVGWQPSVVRAGVAGALASLAWLLSRPRDRWHFMALGAAVLLAWTPASLLEPGFQLSFAAVAAIFVLVPRLERALEGYPLPPGLGTVLAISIACGAATAPILWLQFGEVPLYSLARERARERGRGAAPRDRAASGRCSSRSSRRRRSRSRGSTAGSPRTSPPARGSSPGCRTRGVGPGVAVAVAPRDARRDHPRAAAAAVAAAARAGVCSWPRCPLLARLAALAGDDACRRRTACGSPSSTSGRATPISLQVPQGAVLVDQGPPEATVAGQLRELGVRRLSALVLTHPQRDHIGGAEEVLRRRRRPSACSIRR